MINNIPNIPTNPFMSPRSGGRLSRRRSLQADTKRWGNVTRRTDNTHSLRRSSFDSVYSSQRRMTERSVSQRALGLEQHNPERSGLQKATGLGRHSAEGSGSQRVPGLGKYDPSTQTLHLSGGYKCFLDCDLNALVNFIEKNGGLKTVLLDGISHSREDVLRIIGDPLRYEYVPGLGNYDYDLKRFFFQSEYQSLDTIPHGYLKHVLNNFKGVKDVFVGNQIYTKEKVLEQLQKPYVVDGLGTYDPANKTLYLKGDYRYPPKRNNDHLRAFLEHDKDIEYVEQYDGIKPKEEIISEIERLGFEPLSHLGNYSPLSNNFIIKHTFPSALQSIPTENFELILTRYPRVTYITAGLMADVIAYARGDVQRELARRTR